MAAAGPHGQCHGVSVVSNKSMMLQHAISVCAVVLAGGYSSRALAISGRAGARRCVTAAAV